MKREQVKARNALLKELNVMLKHSSSQYKPSVKNMLIASETNNQGLGIPIFKPKLNQDSIQKKFKDNAQLKKMTKSESKKELPNNSISL